MFNGRRYPVLVTESVEENMKGMSIFTPQFLRTGRVPNRMMLFEFQGLYRRFTMEGVSFPLRVYMLDKNMRVIDHFIAYPNMNDRPISPNTWWMLEISSQ